MKKLFFALITSFLFVATAWGQCTETIFASHQMASIGGSTDTYEYNFIAGRKVKELTLYLQRNSWAGVGPFKIYELGTGSKIYDKRPTDSNSGDYITLTISENATGIKFSNEMTCKANLWNVVIIYRPWIEIPTDDLYFGVVEAGGSSSQRSISIPHSALGSNVTASTGTSFFTFSNPVVKSGTCGPTSLNITFKPTAVGAYSDVITFSNGTKVNVYGECSKRVFTNLEVAKISYTSVLLKWNKVEDADLSGFQIINQATGAIYYADKDDTSLNVTGLEMGKSYSFVIFPLLNGVKSLSASNIVTITTNKTDKIKECLVYTSAGKDNNEQNLIASDLVDDLISYDIKSGNSSSLKYTKRVTFETRWDKWGLIEPSMGLLGDMCMYVKVEGESGFRKNKYWSAANVNLTKTYQTFSAIIPHNTVAIEFRTGLANGAGYRYVKNLQVYKDYILETETPISELDFGEVEPNVSVSKSFKITYAHDIVLSEIAYDNAMKTIISDGLGFYTVNYKDFDDCAQGEDQEVIVTFTPTNCAKEYNATLTLINGAVLEIPLKGTLKRNPGTVKEITWTGAVDTNWDNRANWIKGIKADGNVLSVADVLDEKLKVNIPGGLTRYPVIPDVSTDQKFKTDRDKACDCAQVNAGDNATAKEIAHKIYMEDGATLVGVETLNAGDVSRYGEVEIDFTPVRCYTNDKGKLRYDWTLVGPVVKPWDEATSGQTRNVYSGDYYLNDLPHVYMRKAEVTKKDGKIEADWNSSFPNLDKGLTHDKAFAIKIPNEYGRDLILFGVETEKITAKQYNKYFCGGENVYDAKASHTYTFRGRFYNDASLPTYTLAESGKPYILNNSYPANIDAEKLSEGLNRPIQIYDYKSKAFVTLDDAEDKTIISQSSFIVSAKENNETIEIKKDWFETSKTGRRSASVDTESFRIELRNDANSSASEIYVCYDELKEDEKNYSFDAPKIFNKMEASLPDLYTIRYNEKWSGLVIPTISEPIPLGINVSSVNQSVTFSLKKTTMSSDVILEDRFTKTQYNLSAGETCQVDDLRIGLNEGRFYLLLSEQEEDPEVSTDVEDVTIGNIDIYSQGNSVVVSSTSDIELMQVIVSDMAGRSQVYNVSENYAQLNLPIETGVYTISVVGDKATRVEKIKLN